MQEFLVELDGPVFVGEAEKLEMVYYFRQLGNICL